MDTGEFARRMARRNQEEFDAGTQAIQNRAHALYCAAVWLSGPDGAQTPMDVVNTAKVFESFLNDQ